MLWLQKNGSFSLHTISPAQTATIQKFVFQSSQPRHQNSHLSLTWRICLLWLDVSECQTVSQLLLSCRTCREPFCLTGHKFSTSNIRFCFCFCCLFILTCSIPMHWYSHTYTHGYTHFYMHSTCNQSTYPCELGICIWQKEKEKAFCCEHM